MRRVTRKLYIASFVALLLLTGLTLALSFPDLGAFEVPTALAVASVKAALVGLFFMHLVEHPASSRLTVLLSVLLTAILIGLVIVDIATRSLRLAG